MKKRYDFHTHTLLSDGVLTPSEQISWAIKNNYSAIALTDHADYSNIDFIIKNLLNFIKNESKFYKDIDIFAGIEITHVPPNLIDEMAKYAKNIGAKIVVVHGETISEPVPLKTNYYAVRSNYVDILAHPGLISEEDIIQAVKNDIYIEITTRKSHALTNGHVARLAIKNNAKILINSDVHTPDDFCNYEKAFKIGLGSGISEENLIEIMEKNPKLFINKIKNNDI